MYQSHPSIFFTNMQESCISLSKYRHNINWRIDSIEVTQLAYTSLTSLMHKQKIIVPQFTPSYSALQNSMIKKSDILQLQGSGNKTCSCSNSRMRMLRHNTSVKFRIKQICQQTFIKQVCQTSDCNLKCFQQLNQELT